MLKLLKSTEFIALMCIAVTAPLVVMAMSQRFHSGRGLLLWAAFLFDCAALVVVVAQVAGTRRRP